MPAIVKKYPLYVSDEPVGYKSFIGGINSDQSNEHLLDTELRDGLNVHFQSSGLIKRKGAKLLTTLISTEAIQNVQGVFLFTNKVTYLIIAADGRLFYGVYAPVSEIIIQRLPIKFYSTSDFYLNNPFNMKVGLDIYPEDEIPEIINHQGYILRESTNFNFLGNYYDLTNGSVIKENDYVFLEGFYYLYIGKTNEGSPSQDLVIDFILPTNTNFWLELQNLPNGVNSDLVLEWSSDAIQYKKDSIIKYNNVFYKAKLMHLIRNNTDIKESNLFTLHEDLANQLVFQNFKNIEGATHKNFLYLATGTRIVEVYINTQNVLVAYVVLPKAINSYVATEIGLNQLSPFPEDCLETFTDQAITSVNTISTLHYKLNNENKFLLKPIMTLGAGESLNDYYYRWEKLVNNQWLVVRRFRDNFYYVYIKNGSNYVLSKYSFNYSQLVVDDADQYQYRVSIAKSFEVKESPTVSTETIYEVESLKDIDERLTLDYKVDRVIGDFYGQALSVKYRLVDNEHFRFNDSTPEQLFLVIQSCVKVHADGNKFLFYDDAFNSGEWFKTIIDNPNYIALRGGLSFKTNKNESLIKVVSFAGNILAFANSENVGGSIHLILGNGDDVESDQYYSPYRRKTISPEISTDNAYSVQVAENLLFFKNFDTIYFIQGGELNGERITLYSANDKIKQKNKLFEAPWDDNNCITEINEDFYGIYWPEKNIVENNTVVKIREAQRFKLYYKYYQNMNGKIFFSWLRDESPVFNAKHIFYVNSKPLVLYNNVIVSFNENYYKDFNELYQAKVVFKSYDLEKPKMYKLLDNIVLFYNRNQYTNVDFELEAFNEAGHNVLSYKTPDLVQNKKTLRVGDELNRNVVKLDSTIVDTKVINTTYKFPFLLIQVILTNISDSEFTFGSLTFNYSTVDIPDQNPYGLYKDIVRKDGVFRLTVPSKTILETGVVKEETTSTGTITGTQPSGPRVFISQETPPDIQVGDLWYDID